MRIPVTPATMTANRTEGSLKSPARQQNPGFEPGTEEDDSEAARTPSEDLVMIGALRCRLCWVWRRIARLRESITGFLTEFPIVTLFGVIGIDYLLGEMRILGFRRGVAGLLFAGLAAGSVGAGVALPSIVSTFGLILSSTPSASSSAEILRLHKDLGFVVTRIQHNAETTLATPIPGWRSMILWPWLAIKRRSSAHTICSAIPPKSRSNATGTSSTTAACLFPAATASASELAI